MGRHPKVGSPNPESVGQERRMGAEGCGPRLVGGPKFRVLSCLLRPEFRFFLSLVKEGEEAGQLTKIRGREGRGRPSPPLPSLPKNVTQCVVVFIHVAFLFLFLGPGIRTDILCTELCKTVQVGRSLEMGL